MDFKSGGVVIIKVVLSLLLELPFPPQGSYSMFKRGVYVFYIPYHVAT